MTRLVEVFQARDGQWHWRLVASNGQTLASSEGYVTRWSANRTARKVARALGVPCSVVEHSMKARP